jgi:hypothetical protein
MADIYTDYSTGNDGTGTGTSGNPYKTLGKAISVANGGDTIFVGNNAAEILSAEIAWTGFGGTTAASMDNPLNIKAWDNGGSLVITNPAGDIDCFEIDGNDAVTTLFSTTSKPTNVYIEGMKAHSTTGTLITGNTDWNYYNCEFYDCDGAAIVGNSNTTNMFGCYIHDDGGASVNGVAFSSASRVMSGCYISGISGASMTLGTVQTVVGNIIETGTEGGILATSGDNTVIIGNTIIGDSTAGIFGIDLTGNSIEKVTILNNIITDFSGAGSGAVRVESGSNLLMCGYNSFYNNTDDYTGLVVKGVDLTAFDVTESSDPFTNAAGGDYSLVSGAGSIGTAFPQGFTGTDTLNTPNIGAAQSGIGGGGGGATNVAYGFVV